MSESQMVNSMRCARFLTTLIGGAFLLYGMAFGATWSLIVGLGFSVAPLFLVRSLVLYVLFSLWYGIGMMIFIMLMFLGFGPFSFAGYFIGFAIAEFVLDKKWLANFVDWLFNDLGSPYPARQAVTKECALRERTESRSSDAPAWVMVVVAYLVCIVGVALVLLYSNEPSKGAIPVKPNASLSARPTVSIQVANPVRPFIEHLKAAQAQHPQINLSSRSFDKKLALRLMAKVNEQRVSGQADEMALQSALADIFGGDTKIQYKASQEEVAGQIPEPQCEFKRVMTDQDFINCGRRLPGGR